MVHHLQSEQYQVAVQDTGAELTSFRNLASGLEYVWTADPAVWPRHAPVLFPIVGKLPEGKYSYQGKTYALPQHGFARDENFDLLAQGPDYLRFALDSSAKTRSVYPFDFRLETTYTLQGNSLETAYLVKNSGQVDMYFSLGGHPGFNCPLLPGEHFEDYYLEFEKPETVSRYLLDEGLQNGRRQPVLFGQQRLPLRYELFEQDAIVLKELESQKISLRSPGHAHGLDFEFAGYPYFGIWTKGPGAPFICLEPWHGIAGRVGDSGELQEKEGLICLQAGESFACAYTIRVY